MTETSLHRALLRLIPARSRTIADSMLRRLLSARLEGTEVYTAEYDGKPASVHVSAAGARRACARHLTSEPGPEIPWGWFPDEYGWVMRRVDLDTGEPESLLGGKITKTGVEA